MKTREEAFEYATKNIDLTKYEFKIGYLSGIGWAITHLKKLDDKL